MTEVTKKTAAALAAVNAYLQEEEAHLLHKSESTAQLQPVQQDVNAWALSGRQDMMSLRQLIQMKAFSRF